MVLESWGVDCSVEGVGGGQASAHLQFFGVVGEGGVSGL